MMKAEIKFAVQFIILFVLFGLLFSSCAFAIEDALSQDDQKQPVMACADLSEWQGEITIYKWHGLVQFDAAPRAIDRASMLEWEAVEVDYYATFRPLMYSESFKFEAVINFMGTDAHLWIVSNGGDFWAWPFVDYELGNDGNAHPCGAFEIEPYEHQELFGLGE